MNYAWAGATHLGRVRTNNEDAFEPTADGVSSGPVVLAVADGMGGHVAGEVASRLAIDAAMSAKGSARERILAGNDRVVEAVVADPSLAGMGTTLTLVVLGADGELDLAHIGDSRAYQLRAGDLLQITSDHTLVAELVAEGRLDPKEVRAHPQRNLLTRVIGMGKQIEVEEFSDSAHDGDRLLLCSDGLSAMVDDPEIAELLAAATPEEAVWTLVEAANRAGGEDNVTVIVVDVTA
ncbi:MAG: protein phosphatase 2C domain-containing protein [Acidimicrobiia bacterium]|nr:protein phosphatase 2C domain-containing protein [Acidimicrobiia bacterium]